MAPVLFGKIRMILYGFRKEIGSVMKKEGKDQLIRFIFENAAVRGEIVHLEESYQTALKRHPYPPTVQGYLGEALCAASLLGALLKGTGSLIIQTKSDGPVSLLLAQANAKHEIRGLVKWEGEISPHFSEALGKGHLAITLMKEAGGMAYQGVVDLAGKNLAQVIENYFDQSEQLPSYLFLCSNKTAAAGLFLQLMPEATAEGRAYWEHIGHLAKTIKSEELLNLEAEEVLRRLFDQETVSIVETTPMRFVCKCSREAMAKAIFTLGLDEAKRVLEAHQKISVTCEFCHAYMDFDRLEVEKIFQ
jgi:molecular chaperone Hsp33